jgi:hypothetical protein
MVAAVAQAVTARWISVVMAPSAGTMGAGSPPLVCSDDGDIDILEPSVEEPSGEELSCFQ